MVVYENVEDSEVLVAIVRHRRVQVPDWSQWEIAGFDEAKADELLQVVSTEVGCPLDNA